MIPNALVLKTTKYLTIKNYQAVDASIAQLFKDNEKIPYQNSLKSYDSKIAKEVANNNSTPIVHFVGTFLNKFHK